MGIQELSQLSQSIVLRQEQLAAVINVASKLLLVKLKSTIRLEINLNLQFNKRPFKKCQIPKSEFRNSLKIPQSFAILETPSFLDNILLVMCRGFMSDKPAYQESKDKVRGLPFSSVKEMKAAENEIALDVWKRLTRFKSFNVQLEKEDFKEIKEEFSRGVTCAYSDPKQDDPSDTNILRVFVTLLWEEKISMALEPLMGQML